MDLTSVEIRRKYDEGARSYDGKIGVLEAVTGLKALRKNVLRKAKGSVLLVAVGTGRDLEFLPKDCTVTGIDLSENMLTIARKRGTASDLRMMDAEVLDFPDASFDTVVCTLALCTFPHPLQALREMKRVCKQGGTLLFLEHVRSNVWWIAWLQNRFDPQWVAHAGCHLNREPEKLLPEAGLRVAKTGRSFFGVLETLEVSP